MASPQYASAASPSSNPNSAQQTPTFNNMPHKRILTWSTEDVANFMDGMGIPQYRESWIENEVVGEALIHLDHDELKELGITSVGHRLTILKAVYNVKVAHDVPIEPEHYIPNSVGTVDTNPDTTFVTVSEFQRLVAAIQLRDDKVLHLEKELGRVNEALGKLREELLPIFKSLKEKKPLPPAGLGQPQPPPTSVPPPLPTPNHNMSESILQDPTREKERERDRERQRIEQERQRIEQERQRIEQERERERERDREREKERERDRRDAPGESVRAVSRQDHMEEVGINRVPTPQPFPQPGPDLSRKFSKKRLFLGGAGGSNNPPKPLSPTHNLQNHREQPGQEPSIDSIATSQTPNTAIFAPQNVREYPTVPSRPDRADSSLPTPSSPPTASMLGRSQSTNQAPTRFNSTHVPKHRDWDEHSRDPRGGSTLVSPPPQQPQQPAAGPAVSVDDDSSAPPRTVEIFKSFRVSMDDPCYKVLPAALKRYNIQADWQHYALYIVYGDQERCLELDEKPLILFKQLDKEGKKPMFMLRRHISPETGQPGGVVNGGIQPNTYSRPNEVKLQPPGGVL